MSNGHRLYSGISGSGKTTMMIQDAMEELREDRCIVAVDPLGDSAEELMIQMSEGCSPIRRQDIYYLEIDPLRCFSIGVFNVKAKGVPYQWAHTANIDALMECFAQGQGSADMKEMPLRDRVFKDMLHFIGILQKDGSHYGFQNAYRSLDVHSPLWSVLFRYVAELMPEEVTNDFLLMQRMSLHQFIQFTQSTINWMRRILSPPVLAALTRHENSLDLDEVLERRGILICNFRSSQYLSFEQSSVLCGIIVNKIIEANERLKVPTTLICEEFHRYPMHRFLDAYSTGRHSNLSIWASCQNLASLRTKNIDLLSKVISQSDIVNSFRHRDPDDVEYLAKVHGQPNYDFEPLIDEVQVHAGYDFFVTEEPTIQRSINWGTSRNISGSLQQSATVSNGVGSTETSGLSSGENENIGKGETETHTDGTNTANTRSRSEGRSDSRSVAETSGVSDSKSMNRKRDTSRQQGGSAGTTNSQAVSANSSESQAESAGQSESRSLGTSANESTGLSRSVNSGESSSRNHSLSLGLSKSSGWGLSRSTGGGMSLSYSRKIMTLSRYETRYRRTGRLVTSISDQLEAVKTQLVTLPTGTCLSTKGNCQTVVIENSRLPKIGCYSWRMAKLQRMKDISYDRGFYFAPNGWTVHKLIPAARKNGKKGMKRSSNGDGKPPS